MHGPVVTALTISGSMISPDDESAMRTIAMAPDYSKPPYSFYAPPGTVRVSAAALQLAREFAEEIAPTRPEPEDDWVISFDWADSRFIRRVVDGPREELGAGLDLAASRRSDVPPDVVQIVDDLEFAIRIPRHVREASKERLIDYDETVLSKLTLR
jgi:hypothetical protein